MGNFNMLCGASQQVIQQGDRCMVLPIIQQNSYSSVNLKLKGKSMQVPGVSKHHCYPNCQWTWYGNFLEAKYTNRCEFELLNTVSNQARIFHLVFTLMENAAVAHKSGDEDDAFDIKSFITKEHPALYNALVAATPSYETDWRVALPKNLAEHFVSLSSVFDYIYQGVISSTVYVPAPNQSDTATAMQFAVYHGVVFDHLVKLGEADMGSTREFFEAAYPQMDPKRPGGRLAALVEALSNLVEQLSGKEPNVLEVLSREVEWTLDRLVRSIQQALYYAAHGQYGEFEEIAHGFALRKADAALEEVCYLAARPVIEARFALNAMGREYLLISPMRTASDEGNCLGVEYAQFINKVSALVTAALPKQD